MSAPGAGGRLLSSQCAIAPRGMYGRPEQVGARSRENQRVRRTPSRRQHVVCVLVACPRAKRLGGRGYVRMYVRLEGRG